jgi:hypothetical protein
LYSYPAVIACAIVNAVPGIRTRRHNSPQPILPRPALRRSAHTRAYSTVTSSSLHTLQLVFIERSKAMSNVRTESDSMGEVAVPADKLWGAQTQRSLEHFRIGHDLIPREMITAYATLKKAAANANLAGKRLDPAAHKLITQACDEILAGQHHDMFPLHVWRPAAAHSSI